MRRRHVLTSVLSLVIARDGAAAPETEAQVDAREEYLYPSTVTVRRGGSVVWDWTGQATNNAVDATGLGLFDSGLTPPGGPSFSFAFDAAGGYRYVCTLHAGMAGRVEVPIWAVATADGAKVAGPTRRCPTASSTTSRSGAPDGPGARGWTGRPSSGTCTRRRTERSASGPDSA